MLEILLINHASIMIDAFSAGISIDIINLYIHIVSRKL